MLNIGLSSPISFQNPVPSPTNRVVSFPLRWKLFSSSGMKKYHSLFSPDEDGAVISTDIQKTTYILGSRLGNATALNTCWESFAALMVLPDSNLD
ncbi:hypothetical protein CISIN_1g034440mg [Citrus sinensis]|uniref:Uncharacterized protein n=1 Tax=Citrus sinensis TaxID=2711 RepID=A0A067EL31_CITSI|nr:hypothetical protein CISIN_1g034440mg [Citrus sinensis]